MTVGIGTGRKSGWLMSWPPPRMCTSLAIVHVVTDGQPRARVEQAARPMDVLLPDRQELDVEDVVPRMIDEFLPMVAPNNRRNPCRMVCDGM